MSFECTLAPLLLVRNEDAQHLSTINLERMKWRIMPMVLLNCLVYLTCVHPFTCFLKVRVNIPYTDCPVGWCDITEA